MRRIKLIVAYDGTKYSGWQVQNNADTIEGRLNAALSSICGENIRVIGASRTDAGVHALGNIAVFDTESRIPAEKCIIPHLRKSEGSVKYMVFVCLDCTAMSRMIVRWHLA